MFSILSVGLLVFLSLSQATAKEKPQQALLAHGKSMLWDVQVLSATEIRFGTEGEPRVYTPQHLIKVGLRFSYIGPSGEVNAPSAYLRDADGAEFRMLGNFETLDDFPFEFTEWLMSGSDKEKTKMIESGQTFGNCLFYYFSLAEAAKRADIMLLFGDLQPLMIKIKNIE